jgi:hypothetical protein
VVFALLTLTTELAKAKGENAQGHPTPLTPSGCVPVYLKPSDKKRRKKPGREIGHVGARRNSPEPDERVTLTMPCCPDCGGPVNECRAKSTHKKRTIEDIPEGITAKTTEYDIPTCWCPKCEKTVSPFEFVVRSLQKFAANSKPQTIKAPASGRSSTFSTIICR